MFTIADQYISGNSPAGAPVRMNMFFRYFLSRGYEISVWRGLERSQANRILQLELDVDSSYQAFLRSHVREWRDFIYEPKDLKIGRLSRWSKAKFGKACFFLQEHQDAHSDFCEFVNRIQPDLVWAEHFKPGLFMTHRKGPVTPWVYSQHDFIYRVLRIRGRGKGLRNWIRTCLLAEEQRLSEFKIFREAPVIVAGSATEGEELQRFGTEKAFVVPPGFEIEVPKSFFQKAPSTTVRIVHMGSLSSTANRIGLARYLEVAHADFVRRCESLGKRCELHIVGETRGAGDDLLKRLQDFHAILHGFVKNPADVFCPFDLNIVPYEHNTGNRTRIPFLFAYAQVLAAVRLGVSCFPAIKNLQNAILVEHLEDLPSAMIQVVLDDKMRLQLGTNALQTFKTSFSPEASYQMTDRAIEHLNRSLQRDG